jgi:hypothetical protein
VVVLDVRATDTERALPRPGDDLVPAPRIVMDRAFDLPAGPDAVWPWIVQLGKKRAGWYLPRVVEWLIPPSRRGLRRIDPRWQNNTVGTVVPDYGGRDETFTVAAIEAPHHLVYRSRRGQADVSWAIVLGPTAGGTRIHFRLRVGPVRHRWLIASAGEALDWLTIAGLAGGLRERVR